MTEEEGEVCNVNDTDGTTDSRVVQGYAHARGGDRMSSYGDINAILNEVDLPSAKILPREVTDGIVGPAYSMQQSRSFQRRRAGSTWSTDGSILQATINRNENCVQHPTPTFERAAFPPLKLICATIFEGDSGPRYHLWGW